MAVHCFSQTGIFEDGMLRFGYLPVQKVLDQGQVVDRQTFEELLPGK
jgi:hypothetical protein